MRKPFAVGVNVIETRHLPLPANAEEQAVVTEKSPLGITL